MIDKEPDWDRVCHYQVGDRRFLNSISAWQEILRSGSAFHYSFFDKKFGSYDWTIEPADTWQDLCRQRALALRQRYSWLRLWYSGGRDSHHILRVFLDNAIPLDEIVIFHNQFDPVRDQEMRNIVYPLAQKMLSGTNTRITNVTIGAEDYDRTFQKNWWDLDPATPQQNTWFQPNNWASIIRQRPDVFVPDHSGVNVGNISGADRPRLVIEDGAWHMQVNDRMFECCTGSDSMELFYLSPDLPALHAKQCWMSINHVETHHRHRDPAWIYRWQAGDLGAESYDELCQAVGRGQLSHWFLGLGLNKTRSAADQRFQKIIKHAAETGGFAYENWKSMITDMKNNWAHIFNDGDPLKGTIGILSPKYFVKSADLACTQSPIV
jgi:hypothetical protein